MISLIVGTWLGSSRAIPGITITMTVILVLLHLWYELIAGLAAMVGVYVGGHQRPDISLSYGILNALVAATT
jgi:hypothetical protein